MNDPGLYDDSLDVNPYAAPKATLVPPPLPFEGGNPWLTIWTRPRATMRQILDTDPDRQVYLLSALTGITNAMNQVSSQGVGGKIGLPASLAIILVIGPIWGLVALFVGGYFMRLTGGWLGGRATQREVRSAIAWSGVPVIAILALWIPMLILTGGDLFTNDQARLVGNPPLAIAYMVFGVGQLVLAIWYFVLYLKCIGEAHGFSAWTALAATLVTFLVVMGIFLGIALIFMVVLFAGAMLMR